MLIKNLTINQVRDSGHCSEELLLLARMYMSVRRSINITDLKAFAFWTRVHSAYSKNVTSANILRKKNPT